MRPPPIVPAPLARHLLPALRALASDLLDLVAPLACAACRAPHPSHPRSDRHPPALCALCALSLEDAVDPPPDVVVPYAHQGPLAQAIHHAKYGDDPSVAARLSSLLAAPLAPVLDRIDCIVPVPLHPRRLAHRGFNQAFELARALGRPIDTRSIVRVRDTRSQVGLDRHGRSGNVTGAFTPRAPSALEGRAVLVLDDVVTTGSTLAGVADAVRQAGARSVVCAALGRAPLEAG